MLIIDRDNREGGIIFKRQVVCAKKLQGQKKVEGEHAFSNMDEGRKWYVHTYHPDLGFAL